MKYEIIATSSLGNCTIIDDVIAVDIGVSYKMIKPSLHKLDIIIITHKHSDHFKKSTIKKIYEERPTIKFVVGEYLVSELHNIGIPFKNIIIIQTEKKYKLNIKGKIVRLMFQELSHDVPNIAVHIIINNEKLLYATDTSTLNNIRAKDYDYYLIEGNYKEEELEERKNQKLLNGEFVIETRIANTHLSYEKCIDFFMKNSKDTSILEIMHQHREK